MLRKRRNFISFEWIMEEMTQIHADHICFLRREKIKMWGVDGAARDKAENRKKTPFFRLQKDFPDSDWITFPFVYDCGHENM